MHWTRTWAAVIVYWKFVYFLQRFVTIFMNIFSELFKLIQFGSQLLLQCMTVWVDCPNYESHCLCEILHLPKLWFKLIALYSSLVWNRLSVCKICFYFIFIFILVLFFEKVMHISVCTYIFFLCWIFFAFV